MITRRAASTILLVAFAVLALGGLTAGCDGSAPSSEGEGEAGEGEGEGEAGEGEGEGEGSAGCSPDAAALAAHRACVVDEHCPCGAHCDLGRCVSDCAAAADCAAGRVCDDFGRCVPAGLDNPVLPPRPVTEGHLVIETPRVPYGGPSTTYAVTLRALDGPVSRARVSPGPLLEVALAVDGVADDQLDYQPELEVTDVAEGGRLLVLVRQRATADDDAPFSQNIECHDASGGLSVATVSADAPKTTPTLAGEYEGDAVETSEGLGDTPVLHAPPVRPLATSVRAVVYPAAGGEATIVIEDPIHLIHPAGRWVGRVVLDAAPHVDMPSFEAVPTATIARSRSQVIAEPTGGALAVDPQSADFDGTLTFELTLHDAGITPDPATTPATSWRFVLRRSGDIPEAAALEPARDPPAVPAYDVVAELNTPFPLEERAAEAFGSDGTAAGLLNTFLNEGEDLTPLFGLATKAGSCFSTPDAGGSQSLNNLLLLTSAIHATLQTPASRGAEYDATPFADILADAEARVPGEAGFASFLGGLPYTSADTITLTAELMDVGVPAAITYDVDGRTVGPAVPCDFRYLAASVDSDRGRPWTAPATGHLDMCDAMSRAFACDVLDVSDQPASSREDDIPIRQLDPNSLANLETWSVPTKVERVCVVRAISPRCTQLVACDDEQPDGTVAADAFDPTGAAVDPDSGDLTCSASGASLALGFQRPGVPIDDLLAGCAADVASFEALPSAPDPADTPAARLQAIGYDDDHVCINPIRFLTTLGFAGERLRLAATKGIEVSGATSDEVTLRLLQQWVQAQTMAVSEEVQRAALLPGVEGATASRQEQAQTLAASLEAWRLLLHPRVGSALLEVSGRALHDGDYRAALVTAAGGPPVDDRWSLPRGLIEAMADLLEQQTQLARILIDKQARSSARGLPDGVVETLRTQQVVRAMLAGLAARARASDTSTPPTWETDVDASLARDAAAQGEVRALVDAMVDGKNPLGIEDDDLPLYFDQIRTDAGSRFTAISDFLLGDNLSTNAPAATLVQQALDAFQAARASFLAEQQRLVNQRNSDTEQEVRIANATCELGTVMQDYCGADAFSTTSTCDVPASATTDFPGGFDVRTCWFRGDDPACAIPVPPATQAVTREVEELRKNALRDLCVGAQLRTQGSTALPFVFDTDDPALRDFVGPGSVLLTAASLVTIEKPIGALGRLWDLTRAAFTGLPQADLGVTLHDDLPADDPGHSGPTPLAFGFTTAGELVRVSDGAPIGHFEPLAGYTFVNQLAAAQMPTTNPCANPDAADFPGFLPEVVVPENPGDALTLRCAPAAGFSGATQTIQVDPADIVVDPAAFGDEPGKIVAAQERCDALLGQAPAASPQVQPGPPSSCYRGSLGGEAFSLRALTLEVDHARADFDSLLKQYDISMQSCALLQQGNAALQNAMSKHNDTMKALQTTRDELEIASQGAGAVADCLDTCTSAAGANLGAPVAAGLSVGACAARGASVGLEAGATSVQAKMDAADREHDAEMQGIQAATDEARCFKEAELNLVGMRSATVQVQEALQALSQGYLDFAHDLEQADLTVASDQVDIDWEQEISTRVVGRDPWQDADVQRFERKMKLARRAAYLAVRAVEYEFQQSLQARGEVLRAELPDELDAALDEVRQVKDTGSVNGAQPAELTEVVSLRDHLLQVGDQLDDVDASEHALSKEERFHRLLTDPRFQVHQDGQLVGVEIPFRLEPFSVFNRGNPVGLQIVSDSSCAQRLWSINASLVGDEVRMFQGVVPQVNLEVRQRNTFFATKCADDAAEPFQVASTRPAKNLFDEPGIGAGATVGSVSTDDFAKARVQARLNVDPGTFIDPSFEAGASTELAARLLFGDYTLFIPVTSLAQVDDAGNAIGDGLRLNEVDDILLRFDYLSVAR